MPSASSGWTVRIENVSRVKNVLSRFIPHARREMSTLIALITPVVHNRVQAAAPVGKYWDFASGAASPTGDLKQSLRWSVNGANGTIESDRPYVDAVIDGSPPHAIPGNPLLIFWWENIPPQIEQAFGGNVVRFSSVSHPGTKPNPFHVKGWEAAQPEVQTILGSTPSKLRVVFDE